MRLAAAALGLEAGTTVAPGGVDQHAAYLGLGLVDGDQFVDDALDDESRVRMADRSPESDGDPGIDVSVLKMKPAESVRNSPRERKMFAVGDDGPGDQSLY